MPLQSLLFLALGAQAIESRPGGEPQPDVLPKPRGDMSTWFPTSPYPKEARVRKEQGSVSVTVRIDEKGKPVRCEIDASSGSASLDEATCGLAMKNARFKPASIGGVAVPWRYKLSNITWMLH